MSYYFIISGNVEEEEVAAISNHIYKFLESARLDDSINLRDVDVTIRSGGITMNLRDINDKITPMLSNSTTCNNT